MKLTNKVALISGLGCLALIGSGFAAWTYNTEAVDAKTGNVSAVAGEVAGASATINPTVAGAISLDGKQNGNTQVGDVTWTTAWNASATLTGAAGAAFTMSEFTLTYAITVEGGLATYVSITAGDSGNWVSGEPVTAPTVTFTQDKAPQTKTAWDAMKKAVEASTSKIVITFSATYNA
ncbi:MAG: hypothetical protein LKE31_01955 [Bacilli bacterium]|jgi:hypothetical protein|nr:hypothetical protein [Bacilli bacterium]